LQITKVELKNIKNHAAAEWSFSPGVVAICGPNGAGKTTILEAIAWALFDHLDYNRDDFIKRGAKRGQVAVSFISNLDQREYVVQRDTGGGYSVYDPATKTRLIEQKNQVVPWLQQHIGVEPGTELATLFKTTIGVPQGTFTYDFTLAPAKRKLVFDQILKVEEYRQASDNLRETLRHIEGRITETERQLAEIEGELKTYDEIAAQHQETSARLRALEEEQREAEKERDRAAREAAELDELQRQTETQRGAVERLRLKIEITRDKLASAREAAEQARAAAAIVAAARAGYETYAAATRRLAELDRQREARDELRARAAKVERELIEAQVQSKMSQERLAEVAQARAELAELVAKVREQAATEERMIALREGRGEAQSLQRALTACDRELEKLRQRYAKLSRQIEAADARREQAERGDALEDERMLLDSEIAQKELSLNNYKVKREHLDNLRAEVARLTAEREQTARELARLEPLSDSAIKLAETEAQQQSETERLARLRAEVARDAEMIAGLESGGLCPLLTEKCLNLQPGESLDSRFRSGLEARHGEIRQLETSLAAFASQVKELRGAAAEAARVPKLSEEAARMARELAAQQARVAKLEDETALGSAVTDGEIKELKNKRLAVEALLREAREAQKLYSQAEVLRREIAEIKREGETKRREREELAGRIAKLSDLETQLAETEAGLRALGDPRSRAAALQQTIAREAEWQRDVEKAERSAGEIAARLKQLTSELQAYAALDAEIAAANLTRASHERDYHDFIAHEQIAATVAARESEVAAITAEIAQAEAALAAALDELRALEARYDAERHHQAQAELSRWRERATQLATQLEHTREQFQRLQTQLDHLNEVREQMRAQLAAKEQTVRLRETADFIRDILQKAAPFITESYLFSISLEANQLFREITGRYDVTLRWNKDYEITLEEEGRERPFANLSGGEQMAAALAVRLALLKELSEINLAFFDEPTTNMDEERRRNLAQQIGRIKDFQQLFVISHDDSFEGYTDQIIMLGNGNQ
jgi:exonuclease SbcC